MNSIENALQQASNENIIGSIHIDYNSMNTLTKIINETCSTEHETILYYTVDDERIYLATNENNIKTVKYEHDPEFTYKIMKTKLKTNMDKNSLFKFFTDDFWGFSFSRKVATNYLELTN